MNVLVTSFLQYVMFLAGVHGVVVVEALRYKPEGRGFDSRWCHWIVFVDIILLVALRLRWSSS
jgi:hypothetical protein